MVPQAPAPWQAVKQATISPVTRVQPKTHMEQAKPPVLVLVVPVPGASWGMRRGVPGLWGVAR